MLTKLNDAVTIAGQIAHSIIAIAGSGAASAALIVAVLSLFKVNVTDAQVIYGLGELGGVATLVSKAIDSAHDAITTKAQLQPGATTNALG